jgi:hypothetical protein
MAARIGLRRRSRLGGQKQNVALGPKIWSYATVSDKWQLLKY